MICRRSPAVNEPLTNTELSKVTSIHTMRWDSSFDIPQHIFELVDLVRTASVTQIGSLAVASSASHIAVACNIIPFSHTLCHTEAFVGYGLCGAIALCRFIKASACC
jgi:hypothetical protein